ncbi:30S ribosomal protein S19e [Candidatus Woesearchaeota archaeon]|nr:30S ribosomal protein S19e [Candidatus Woesearchaeota archaeon]
MTGINDVYPNDLIDELAELMKDTEEIKAPEWAAFAKTGSHKERPPAEKDWWYPRSAAILRTIYKFGPIGTEKLRTKYGGKKRRGHQPPIFRKAGGSVIRKVLQQLEKAGLVEQAEKGVHKGRILTAEGKALLKKAAEQAGKKAPVQAPKKEVQEKKEAPVAEKPKQEVEEKKEQPVAKKETPKEEKKES